MTTTSDRPTKGAPPYSSQNYTSKYKVVGTRPIRHDGLDKVTGRARYGADISLPGMLHGKLLRSPHAHAKIISIDATEALKLDGVKAVVTAKDLPIIEDQVMDLGETMGNPRVMAENILAKSKALYKGHAVAAVAAISPHVAELALDRIKVEYEVLPPQLDAEAAMREDAPLILEELTTQSVAQAYVRGTDTGVKSNIASHIQMKRGDLEQGFKNADVIVERVYKTTAVHQGYIEPQSSTAYWAPDGRITIWTSTQGHFTVRTMTAAMLGVPEHSVKVIPMEIGGGFGGKIPGYLDPVCSLLSKKTGHPVKIVLTRKEVFEATGPTSGSSMRCKVGANKSGRITAAELYLVFEAGAFPGSPVGAAAMCSLTSYNIENFQIDGYDVIVNRPKVQAYRGPGSPIGTFAAEGVMDEVAEKLGMDPLEFRLKNAAKEGDRMPNGMTQPRIGCVEVEEAMKAHPHYKIPLGPNQGRGTAMGFWFNAGGPSSVTLGVNADGTVNMISGSVDIGGTRPAIAMQAAEVLGVSAEDMVPSVGDTDSIGFTNGTGGSRTAFATGTIAIEAAREVRDKMAARAALIWEIKPEEVVLDDGVFVNGKNPDDKMTFKQLAARLIRTGGPISASASGSPRGVGAAYCGNMVDVEVDPETGKVTILRYTVFQDVGQAAHPSFVEGQMQGGTVQGIGWALNEEYYTSEDGVMLNSSFLDYRMPTSLDLPMIDTVLIEVPNPGHPFGVRGVGEVSIVPPMAAIANAIYDAVGVRMDRLPMSPGAVLEALEAKKAQG